MKNKILGISVCMLLIATVLSATATMTNNENYIMTSAECIDPMQQTVSSGGSMLNWLEETELLASDGDPDDGFGYSVSMDGDYVIVGAYDDDDIGYNSGSAYIFKRDGTTWTEEAKLLPSDGQYRERFGYSVSIDGDYVIIGANNDDDNGEDSGSAYIFKRDGTTWIEQAKLLPSDGATENQFGISVSIDGDYAIIGAYRDDDNGEWSGSAYVFKRDGTTWTQQTKLLPSDGATENQFGISVSIDGEYAIIGSDTDDSNGATSGSAYIFKRDGTTWNEQAKLLASDGENLERFGYSVSIDGDYVIIGAIWDHESGVVPGSAYVFKRDGANWVEQAKLSPSDGEDLGYFGCSVSISGNCAVVGASRLLESKTGSAYIFKRIGTYWYEETKLIPSNGKIEDRFGCSVSIDGDYAIVGAYENDDNSGEQTGSSFIFKRSGNNEPPAAPNIDGPNGEPGTFYDYTFTSIDPDGDEIAKYIVTWGDYEYGEPIMGPFASGEESSAYHAWAEEGTYVVTARAIDSNGLIGSIGSLSVTMPVVVVKSKKSLYQTIPTQPYIPKILEEIIEPDPIGEPIFEGIIITVDDDRVECPDADYTSIQDAIDDSVWCGSGGWEKIVVYPGTYYEDIEIIGDGKNWAVIESVAGPETTIIHGSSNTYTVKIESNWVHITGFTIMNGGEYYSGIQTDFGTEINNCVIKDCLGNGITGNNANIRDCIIKDCSGDGITCGIFIYVNGCSIKDCSGNGITCGSNTDVKDSVIENNSMGIFIPEESDGCVIYHNAFYNNVVNAYDSMFYPYSRWGCNYWDDYVGQDMDGDNIGDILYTLGDYSWEFFPSMVTDDWPNIPADPVLILPSTEGGKPLIPFHCYFITSDLDGDSWFFRINWGDGEDNGWYYSSVGSLGVDHTYAKKGTYTIEVYVKDAAGRESWYYSCLEVGIGTDEVSQQSTSVFSTVSIQPSTPSNPFNR